MVESNAVELVAVSSRTRDKAEACAREFGSEPITGYERLLERQDIEAIYMPLPAALHEEWAIRALEADKHILVEKSFAESSESAERMLDVARERRRFVLENFLFTHHAQYGWVRERLEGGEIGDLLLLRSSFSFPPLEPSDYRYSRELGGGALLDVGCYMLKVSRCFLGDDVELRAATLERDAELGVDLSGAAMLSNPCGQTAQVYFGFHSYYQSRYELLGTRGKLTLARAFTAPPGFQPTARLEHQGRRQELTLPADNQYRNMWRFFADTARQPELYETHRREILHQARLVDAVRKEGSR